MICRRLVTVAFIAGMALPWVASAQSGTFDPRTQWMAVLGSETNNQSAPLLALVIWRGDWTLTSPGEGARLDSLYRAARFQAEETRQSVSGGRFGFAVTDYDHTAITVEGQRFQLIPDDSVIVIMVAIPPNNLPRSVTTTRIAILPELPAAFLTKHWQSGDTTFFVHPNYGRQQALLREALGRSTVVTVFLDRQPNER